MQNFETNSALFADEKKYRKLRKYLRQIEHLNLVPRPLNEEEKQKVLRKNFYRQQLNELIAKYPNNELSFRDPPNNTTELDNSAQGASDETRELNSFGFESKESPEANKNDSFDLEELTSKMNTLIIEKPIIIAKPAEQSTPEIVSKAKEEPEPIKLETKPIKQKIVKKQEVLPPKPVVCFDFYEIENAHQDLITSVDMCAQHELIVTGSRDTSIKVWSIKDLKNPKLIHSFGGHSGSVTLVKFWSNEAYHKCLNNLALATGESVDNNSSDNDDDENDDIEKEVIKKTKEKYPLIISSSLDCSMRIWNINREKCIKELYLYNPINHFCLSDLSFVVALGAGKIQLWNNLTQSVVLKAFDDSESVCCVKMSEETKKVYALSHTGILKQFEIKQLDEKYSLDLNKVADIYSLLSETHTVKKNFKSFEILSTDRVVLINDNQSFLILFNLTSNSYQLVSTNTHSYGFTSCFYKLDNLLLVSAYNIDDESSNINVFDCESLQYCYSLYDSIPSNSLSSLTGVCKPGLSNRSYLIVGTSREAVKLWSTCELMNETFMKSGKKQVKSLRMCKKAKFHVESCNEEDESDDEEEESDDDNRMKANLKQTENIDSNSSRRYCSIQ